MILATQVLISCQDKKNGRTEIPQLVFKPETALTKSLNTFLLVHCSELLPSLNKS
jgi:hypothetical protein